MKSRCNFLSTQSLQGQPVRNVRIRPKKSLKSTRQPPTQQETDLKSCQSHHSLPGESALRKLRTNLCGFPSISRLVQKERSGRPPIMDLNIITCQSQTIHEISNLQIPLMNPMILYNHNNSINPHHNHFRI